MAAATRALVKTAIVLAVIVYGALPAPAAASSYYPVRPDDPRAVYVTRDRFGAVGDGIADDTAALQKAIDAVQEATGEGVVLRPAGPVPPLGDALRLAGHPHHRLRRASGPCFVLGDRTPGYQDPETPRYMVFFAGRRPKDGAEPPDANPGTFYSALSNVDLEIGAGNPGAVGVRARYAQHCFTSHVEFRIGSGLAGRPRGRQRRRGRALRRRRVRHLDRHAVAGLAVHAARRPLRGPAAGRHPRAGGRPHPHPPALPGRADRGRDRGGPAGRPLREGRAARERDAGRRSSSASRRARARRSTWRTWPAAAWRRSRSSARAGGASPRPASDLRREDVLARPPLRGPRSARARRRRCSTPPRSPRCPPPSRPTSPPLPPGDTWVNARTLGARGDGTTDDTAALQKAIDAHRTVYLPIGQVHRHRHAAPAARQRARRPAPERHAARGARPDARRSRASGPRSRCSRRRRAAPRSSSASGSTRTASTRGRSPRSGWPGRSR